MLKILKRIALIFVVVVGGFITLGLIVGPPPSSKRPSAGNVTVPTAQPDRMRPHRDREVAELIKRLETVRQRFTERCYKFIVQPEGCKKLRDPDIWNGIYFRLRASTGNHEIFNEMVEVAHEFEREIGRIEFEAWANERPARGR